MSVDQKRDLLKGDERNADRQDDIRNQPLSTKNIVYVRDEETSVFEITQDAEIKGDADR
jgi:hypothetical protein